MTKKTLLIALTALTALLILLLKNSIDNPANRVEVEVPESLHSAQSGEPSHTRAKPPKRVFDTPKVPSEYQPSSIEPKKVSEVTTGIELQNFFIGLTAGEPDEEFAYALQERISAPCMEYLGHSKLQVRCSKDACRILALEVGRNGATLCDVLPYRIGWLDEIYCMPNNDDVILARHGVH